MSNDTLLCYEAVLSTKDAAKRLVFALLALLRKV